MALKIHLIFSNNLLDDIGGSSGAELLPPLGILYIASYLRKTVSDIKIKVTNGLTIGYNKIIDEICSFEADIFGISFQTTNSTGAYRLINFIKQKYSEKLVVAGGVHSTLIPGEVFENSKVDIVCIGESELTFSEIVNIYKNRTKLDINDYNDISGIIYRKNGQLTRTSNRPMVKNLDDLPFPAWDLLDFYSYSGGNVILSKKTPSMMVLSSRGCPFKCNFCANLMWQVEKPFVRRRSPKNFFDEVEYLIKNYNIKEYNDQCNAFNVNIEHAIKMCEEKIRRKIDIYWYTNLRAHPMENELAKLMKQSNCWAVSIGMESANPETLIGINKNVTISQFERTCEILKRNGIKVCANFMFLHAWEKDNELYYEDVEKSLNTLNYAKKIFRDKLVDYFTWSQSTPYPGSRLYDTAKKYNLIHADYNNKWEKWNHVWNFVMILPTVTVDDCNKLKNLGIIAQIKTLIVSKNINLRAIKFILKRIIYFIKNIFKYGLAPKYVQ